MAPTPPAPPVVGPATPPIIRSIAVPASRVEAGQDVTITAVVEDAETPVSQLSFQWSASAGAIVGAGPTATWRHDGGITAGINVVVTLTVIDKYQAVEGNQIVEREFRVVSQAPPFRVHDSTAEMKELARKFLVDLFGNSSVPPEACLVDFSESCASVPNGKNDERNDIILHRQLVIVQRVTIYNQMASFPGTAASMVVNDTGFWDFWLADSKVTYYQDDFVITGIYEAGRWWICQSYVNRTGGASKAQALYGNKRGGWFPVK